MSKMPHPARDARICVILCNKPSESRFHSTEMYIAKRQCSLICIDVMDGFLGLVLTEIMRTRE